MTTFLSVLGFALLPAIGIIIGSLLEESIHTPKWLVGASLHATARIAIALVNIDVMPRLVDFDCCLRWRLRSPCAVVEFAVIGAGVFQCHA